MVGGRPSGLRQGPAELCAGNWPPPYVGQPTSRPRPPLIITAAVAVAALIVAVTRSTGSPSALATSTAPTRTAVADQQPCNTNELAAHALQASTNGCDEAQARTATTDASVMPKNAVADPAHAQPRDATRVLATANLTATAKATNGVAADTVWQIALDGGKAKDAAMKQVCGGG